MFQFCLARQPAPAVAKLVGSWQRGSSSAALSSPVSGPSHSVLQPTMTYCRLPQPTLTTIAAECDRAKPCKSMLFAEIDFGK